MAPHPADNSAQLFCSLDLDLNSFFLGRLQQKMYLHNPHNFEASQIKIWDIILQIEGYEFQLPSWIFLHQCEMSVSAAETTSTTSSYYKVKKLVVL